MCYCRSNVSSDGGNNLFTPNSQNTNEGAFFGTETDDVVGEPPPQPNHHSLKNMDNDDAQPGNFETFVKILWYHVYTICLQDKIIFQR